MSTRPVVANVLGLAACVAVGYAINGRIGLGSCGDVGMPACTGAHGARIGWLLGGILVAVMCMIARGSLAFTGLFAAWPRLGSQRSASSSPSTTPASPSTTRRA